MGKQKKKARLKTRLPHVPGKPRIIHMQPEEVARYINQAEVQILPIMKEIQISAGAAILLLAQYTQALITGYNRISAEGTQAMTANVLAVWQAGYYTPGAHYPFTLEETLEDLNNEVEAKADYGHCFQPFTPSHALKPTGIGQVAGGLVQHPKTLLWQIWIIMDGPCTFLGAYHDPKEAQGILEKIVNMARYEDANVARHEDIANDAQRLYHELMSLGDGKPIQIPYDMMLYLLDHLHLYMIEL